MGQRRSRKESDAGTERTEEESVTSTSCRSGGGEEEGEEVVVLKKQRTEVRREGEDEEVESERGSDRNSAESWEKLSPMLLRVLLVEADDSTRQIISALLRKCGYRVAAVPNGLKAWEMLKGKPNEIDLILTEVDLPSVSGYALLSLIMDHEICKNIPVIMMSTEDSIVTVYKCMLRGAADYLIKPIRRNELGNLWQHVWRRQTALGRGIGMKDKDGVQDKLDPACEKKAASKCSSGDGAFSQRNKESAEKGSDTQSSCMVVDVDDVGSGNEDQPAAACKDSNGMTVDNVVKTTDMDSKACDGKNANITGEEIDFMGAAPPHISSSTHMKSEFDTYGRLDLSLKSSFRGGFEIEPASGKNSLGHSNASSFTRYTGKQLYLQHSESATVSNPKELAADSDRNFSGTTDTDGPSPGSISPPVVQVKESETENAQQNLLQTQDLVCGMRTNDIKNPASSSMYPLFQPSVDASPQQTPSTPNRTEASVKSSHASDSTNESPLNQDKRSESSQEDQGHVTTPVVDRGSSSSLSNGGGASHNNSAGGYGSNCGSNSDVDQTMIKAESESNNNSGSFTHSKSSTRSVQREAALAKFRLKRKDRCFDKKVRYESRKTLAEQRPRVKGQFVRQIPAAPQRVEQ